MRVAIVAEVFLPKIDGVVNRTLNLIRNLRASGDQVLVICPATDDAMSSPAPTVQFPSFPFPAYPEYRVGMPDRRLVTSLRDFAPDVIHYVNPFAFGFRCYDLIERQLPEVPSVFSFHTLYGEFVKKYGLLKPLGNVLWWVMREYHNCADANLTVSTPIRDELTERGFERVGFWPPAVDSELFCPARACSAMRARLAGDASDRPLLLTVSRLAPEKNVGFLADVLRRVPGARLAIVGDGPHRAELEKQFAGLDAHFVGYLQGVELARAYASSDLFVYASETETMGNVVMEAMASGRAVVAPSAGGIPSLIRDGATGALYSPGDVDQAVEHVRRLLGDQVLRNRIERAAYEDAAPRTWAASTAAVRELYRETIDEAGRADARGPRSHKMARLVVSSLVLAFRSLSATHRRKASRRQSRSAGIR